ncbi:4096_t:CDS:2 [Entrophospora sp. SA101]|nr:4096_t:CDS:2 [Entrophospora sp. SA101]
MTIQAIQINISKCESENCSNYGSDYESDTETSTIKPQITQSPKVEEQVFNTTSLTEQVSPTYSKRQERFDEKFTQKDVMNKIRKIVSSPARDMSNNKGSLDDIHLWDYLLPNYGAKEGISLLDAEKMGLEKVNARDVFICICCSFIRALYRILDCSWEEILKGLVIATSSDSSKCSYHLLYAPTLLIDYLELKEFTELVYRLTGEKYGKFIDRGLPGQNFCLHLIGSAKKDRVKRILHFSLDNGWNDLNDARVQPPTSLRYEIRPCILSIEKINNQKKIIVGQDALKKYANLILQKYSEYLRNWDIEEKNSQCWAKCESPLTMTEVYEKQCVEPLPKEGDVYLGSPWETGKTYTLEHLTIPDGVNLLVLSTRHTYSSAVTTRLNLKSYTDINGNINLPDHQRVVCQIESLHRIINKYRYEKKCKCSPIPYDLWLDEIVSIIAQAHTHLAGRSREELYKLIQEARWIIVMDNDLTDLNIEWVKNLRRNKLFSVIHNTYQPQKGKTFRLAPNKETVLAKLWEWAKQMSSLPPNEQKSASLICHLRKDVQGIVRALRTNFPELHIKNYHGKSDPAEKAQDFGNVEEAWKEVDLVAYTSTLKIGFLVLTISLSGHSVSSTAISKQMLEQIKCCSQRASNATITEEGLFNWLLKAKRECLPQELQNRGVFPDVESIIRNKDFLKKADMVVSIIKATPKAKDNTMTLTETVKGHSSVIKAEEISKIANANILNHEMVDHLENKPKKTLEEMHALSRYHIADCYEISPESLTEEFITDYGKYDHMRWFRNLRKLRDAGTDNMTAVEAITHEDYRNNRLTTITQAEKHRIESIQYLQNLVPKMAQVLDNTDASRSAKKSGLKSDKAKLGLLNSALSAIYGIKFKTTNNKNTHYHLVGAFDNEDAPKLPPYQTGEDWENGEEWWYSYSKLSPDELETSSNSITQDTQDLFDIC